MSFFFKVVTSGKETQMEQRQMLMVPMQDFSKTKAGPAQGLPCRVAEATPPWRRRMHHLHRVSTFYSQGAAGKLKIK